MEERSRFASLANDGAARGRTMEIYDEAKRYVRELRSLPDFLKRAQRKGVYCRQGDFEFIGTR